MESSFYPRSFLGCEIAPASYSVSLSLLPSVHGHLLLEDTLRALKQEVNIKVIELRAQQETYSNSGS